MNRRDFFRTIGTLGVGAAARPLTPKEEIINPGKLILHDGAVLKNITCDGLPIEVKGKRAVIGNTMHKNIKDSPAIWMNRPTQVEFQNTVVLESTVTQT